MSLKTVVKRTNKSSLVQVRLDEQTKSELEPILSQMGLTTSQAILIYIKQVILKGKIPFELSASRDFDDRELTQEGFERIQGYLVTQLDKDEEIPEFHERNARAFVE